MLLAKSYMVTGDLQLFLVRFGISPEWENKWARFILPLAWRFI
jgi:hypothetical protein